MAFEVLVWDLGPKHLNPEWPLVESNYVGNWTYP